MNYTTLPEEHMKKAMELTVITKMYDLILWSCNHTSRFPRNHRFVRFRARLFRPRVAEAESV